MQKLREHAKTCQFKNILQSVGLHQFFPARKAHVCAKSVTLTTPPGAPNFVLL